MTNLNCTQCDCAYNCDGCCSQHTIEVGGSQNALCCSYCQGEGDFNAVAGSGEPQTAVRCGERSCCHNEGCSCQAEHVQIENCDCGPKCKNFE